MTADDGVRQLFTRRTAGSPNTGPAAVCSHRYRRIPVAAGGSKAAGGLRAGPAIHGSYSEIVTLVCSLNTIKNKVKLILANWDISL